MGTWKQQAVQAGCYAMVLRLERCIHNVRPVRPVRPVWYGCHGVGGRGTTYMRQAVHGNSGDPDRNQEVFSACRRIIQHEVQEAAYMERPWPFHPDRR